MTNSLKTNMINLCFSASTFQVVQEAPHLIYRKHTVISPPEMRIQIVNQYYTNNDHDDDDK